MNRSGVENRSGVVNRSGRGRVLRALVPAAVLAVVVPGTTGCSSSPSVTSSGAARAQLVAGAATRSEPPPTQAATGRLVSGFPSRLLPLLPGATVTASAVQRHDELAEVSVSATTPTSAKKVLEFYAATLTKAGFTKTDGSMLPPGAAGLAFSHDGGRELIVVAVVDRGALSSFSVGGTVAADDA